MMKNPLRRQLVEMLQSEHAHPSFAEVVARLPPGLRGRRVGKIPYSAWQLLEHLRITQWDILEFSRGPGHESPEWPEGYWPKEAEPPRSNVWEESIARFVVDRRAFTDLIEDDNRDLLEPFPHGEGQTLLREAVLIIDHTSWHLGQLVVLRRELGAWPPEP